MKIKYHDKFKADKIFLKVRANFYSFIPDFANEILKAFNFEEKFIKIDYENIKKLIKVIFPL